GFSVSDFDLDGKTDIVFGTGRGNVFVIENEGENQYTNSWAGSVESYHAYIHTHSNDIDKNGKPEFWVLADAFYNGIATTRITIFETNGDNSYHVVGRIDLIGVFSFYAGTMQAVDIDNDGTEEIAVCIDDNFLILKFNGSRDHHTYELYYIKQNDLLTPGEWTTYYGAIMYDLKQNGDYNILISMSHILSQQTGRVLTKIYKPDSLSSVANYDRNLPESSRLEQNFPNPFNPSTNIAFGISGSIAVTLKVYDILGKEIKTLLQEELSPGNYTVSWEARDSNGQLLPSGVYLIQLNAGNYTKTLKALLMR
ncbi:MAG TPA: FG-GAP-like repeat-containing protein, partial [Ignavibacteriaceae bacterium]|nr:FG-GAP-like repeat-containing protein [Ignavibacteriaceae bacterium]